jgi:raffinose/stachyose/melibiose transport system permease protein
MPRRIESVPRHRRRYVACITAIMFAVALVYFIPLWYALNNAFKPNFAIQVQPLLITPATFTFANVLRAFRYLDYPATFLNSALVLVLTLAILVITGSLAAYGLVMSRHRLFTWVHNLIILLITLPFQLAMVPLIKVLDALRLVNTRIGLALIFAAVGLPFTIFLYSTGIRGIPGEINEAATMDGCGMLRAFLHVYMPLLKNVTGTVMILRGVGVWNDFMITLITITSASQMTLPLRLFAFIATYNTDWGLLFAGTLLVTLPMIVVFLLLQKTFIKGVASGSLKG